MPDLDVILSLPADTYADSTDAADHSGALKAPLNPDTAYLVRFPLGGIPAESLASGWSLVVTAAAAFDGSPALALHRLAEPFDMGAGATLPDFTADAPVTFTGAVVAGQQIAFDVTTLVQKVIDDPASDYGWALVRTDAGTAGSIWTSKAPTPSSGSDVAPTLTGVWATSPGVPDNLRPAGNRAASVAKPVLSVDFAADVISVQVQIDASLSGWTAGGGFPSPDFDSGEVASSDPSLDLSATAYAGIPNVGSVYWSMRVKDATGWSDWAPPAQTQLAVVPAVTVTSGAVAGEVSPTVTFTSGSAMSGYQVIIADAAGNLVEDSGFTPASGTSGAYTMSTLLPDSSPMTATVRVWDTLDNREATPGAPVYGQATQGFAYADDQGIAPPDDVIAVGVGSSPWVDLFVTLHAEPQELIAVVDGKHQGRYTPADLDPPISGEGTLTYRIRLWDLQPYTDHVIGAKRVDHHQTSAGVFYALDAIEVVGTWVADKQTGVMSWCAGVGQTYDVQDQVGLLQALGASYPIVQLVGRSGLVTTIAASPVRDDYGQTAEEWHKAWRQLIHQSTGDLQIAYGNVSYPCRLYNFHADIIEGERSVFVKAINVIAVQVGPSSLADEPADPGSQSVSTFDFEEGTNGAAIVVGTSPGVIDKQGSPTYATAAKIHNNLGFDNGAAGSTLTYRLPCPGVAQFYIKYPSKSGSWAIGTATVCQVEDVNGTTIFDLGPRTNGLYVLNDALGNTLAMGTQKREPFDGSLVSRIEVLVTWDGTNATGIFKIFYAAESSTPDEQFQGTVVAAQPYQVTVNNNAARVRAYVDTVQVASDASAWLPAFAPDDTPAHLFSWLGGTTQTSALVNSVLDPLLDPGKSVDLAWSTSSTMSSPHLVGAQTVRADGTVQHAITGLSAHTDYWFQLHFDGAPFGRVLHVKTDPSSTANWSRDVIPASCLGNFAGGKTPDAALQDILTVGLPAEWWWLGDEYWGQNIAWSDSYTQDIAKQSNWQTQFTALRAIVEQTNLRARTISDHNLFDNGDDAPSNGYDPKVPGSPAHIFGSKEPVREIQAFQAMTPVRVYGDTRSPRVFRSYYSDLLVDGSGSPLVRVVTSDMRTPERNNSDDTDGPGKSLWGVAQENWLYGAGGPLDVPHQCLVIFVNETSWWRNTGALRASDKPAAYPDAQTRLMARLNGSGEFAGMNDLIGAGKFLWVGGDRHYCAYQSAATNPDGFPQIISSGIQKNWLALQDGEGPFTGSGEWITPVPASPTDPDQAVAQYVRISLSYVAATHVLTASFRCRYVADTSGDPATWVFSDLPSAGPTVLTWTLT